MYTFVEMFLGYFLFMFMYLLCTFLFRYLNKIRIIGKENLPHTTHILYISVHRTFIDSLLIGFGLLSFKELLFFPGRIPYNAPDFKNFYSNKFGIFFMRLLKNIPVDRNSINGDTLNGKKLASLIEKYCKILMKSNLLLFPEGGRTKPGSNEMNEFKSGTAKLILIMTLKDKNFKVVPVYIDESMNKIMPREIGQSYLKIKTGFKGYMMIGKEVTFLDICIRKDIKEKEKLELIKNRGREAILSLKNDLRNSVA